MTYEETISKINDFLHSPEAIQTFGPHVDKFKRALSLIECHIEELKKSDKVNILPQDSEQIKETIALIKTFLLEFPVTAGLREFIDMYSNLVLNWVYNCAPDNTNLIVDVKFIKRFVVYHLTSSEVIEILPHMMQKILSMQNIGLPSVELARHYLGTLGKKEGE